MPADYPTGADLKKFYYAAGVTNSATAPTGRFASLDYDLAAGAARTDFERDTRRVFLAVSGTRVFDPPPNRKARLFCGDVLSVSSVTYLTLAIASTEYRLGPDNNPAMGLPYFHLDFFRRWEAPATWYQRGQLSVVGSWGYATALPDDVFQGMLCRAAADLYIQVASKNSGQGLRNWSEADVHEDYGDKPGENIEMRWRKVYDRAVAQYRNLTEGFGDAGQRWP